MPDTVIVKIICLERWNPFIVIIYSAVYGIVFYSIVIYYLLGQLAIHFVYDPWLHHTLNLI